MQVKKWCTIPNQEKSSNSHFGRNKVKSLKKSKNKRDVREDASVDDLLQHLNAAINSKKYKNIEILELAAEVSYTNRDADCRSGCFLLEAEAQSTKNIASASLLFDLN